MSEFLRRAPLLLVTGLLMWSGYLEYSAAGAAASAPLLITP